MRVRHLNCGTLRPRGGKRVNGDRHPLAAARMVCHCLLVETADALVLVDTGYGTADIARLTSWRNMMAARAEGGSDDSLAVQLRRRAYTSFAIRAKLDPAETALAQLQALGYAPSDLTDIVLTHLDLDHAGGLPDFPDARVHVTQSELDFALVAQEKADGVHRFRYWPYQWAHGPRWTTYGEGGDSWYGLAAVRELVGLPDFALVPLPGHTAGQCGVAVATSNGGPAWLLHAADAYLDHRQIDPDEPFSPPGIAAFEARFEFDGEARLENRARLRELATKHGPDVRIFCSHDPVEFDQLASAGA